FACYTAKVTTEAALEWRVFGSKGTLQLIGSRLVLSHGGGSRETTFRFDTKNRGYAGQWRNFCCAIRGEELIVSTPERAYGDLLVIDAALRSAHGHRREMLSSEAAMPALSR